MLVDASVFLRQRQIINAIVDNDIAAVRDWVRHNDINTLLVYRFSGSMLKDELADATPLNLAICMRREDIALFLLDNGAIQNVPTYRTTGCYASEVELPPLATAIDLKLHRVGRAMVEKGVDLGYRRWRWNEDMGCGFYDPPFAMLLLERAEEVLPFFRCAGVRAFFDQLEAQKQLA